jgi:hypothetical protein
MKPRGRPRKDGAKAAWVLYRAMVGLRGYDKARSSGEKYQEALKGAVAEVRHQFPGMPISETEIKRILAEFRSKELELTFLVTESEDTTTLDGRKCGKAWQISIGPLPNHPRHNAHEDRPKQRATIKRYRRRGRDRP